MMEINALVKRMLGNEWNARDAVRVERWVRKNHVLLPDFLREAFDDVVLSDRNPHEFADDLHIAWATLRGRLTRAHQIMGVLAKAMTKNRFRAMFVSVYEHEFGNEVRTRELTETLFGWYDRRSTQNIHVKWIPQVSAGELDLPMPQKNGKYWVWTKEQASAWRKWYVERDLVESVPDDGDDF